MEVIELSNAGRREVVDGGRPLEGHAIGHQRPRVDDDLREGLGFRRVGFEVWGLRFWVWGLGFGILGLGFGVWG